MYEHNYVPLYQRFGESVNSRVETFDHNCVILYFENKIVYVNLKSNGKLTPPRFPFGKVKEGKSWTRFVDRI